MEAFTATCPYKCEGKFILKDVGKDDKIKRYSDSQYMSFYSNNIGKLTVQSQGFYNSKIKINKENKSPEPPVPTYDPFGGRDYKVQFFQNSAHNFMARRPLDVEAIANATNEDLEESKSGEV